MPAVSNLLSLRMRTLNVLSAVTWAVCGVSLSSVITRSIRIGEAGVSTGTGDTGLFKIIVRCDQNDVNPCFCINL